MSEIPIRRDPNVPPGTVYVGTPRDFQLVGKHGLVAFLHPETVVDPAVRREIEAAHRRLGQITGLGRSEEPEDFKPVAGGEHG